MLAVFRDITELREREEALAAAKEDVERTRELMQTILDNMSDGVTLWDKDFRWKFSNRVHIERQRYTPDMLRAGDYRLRHDPLPGAARRIWRPERGRTGKQGPGGRVDHPQSRAAATSGARERPLHRVHLQPLADGSMLGVYRDITELKEREQAVEQARSIMQIGARQHERRRDAVRCRLSLEIHQPAPASTSFSSPADVVEPDLSLLDILRFQAKRGDFGTAEDAEKLAACAL